MQIVLKKFLSEEISQKHQFFNKKLAKSHLFEKKKP
jgi:hypothetical protein